MPTRWGPSVAHSTPASRKASSWSRHRAGLAHQQYLVEQPIRQRGHRGRGSARRKTFAHRVHLRREATGLERLQGNQELNTRFQRELTRLQLADQILKLREKGKLSQAQLARKIGTHQSAVARMEQSTYRGYTVATLAKIAAAAGARLEVRFVPRGRHVKPA